MKLRNLRQWGKDEDGAALVELGLVGPILVAIVVGVIAVGYEAFMLHDMRAAVSSGAQYVMGGGRATADIQQVVVSAWNRAPSGATTTVTQACVCGGVSASCNGLCAGGSAPQSLYTITATGTFNDSLLHRTETITQVVRVR